MHTKGEEKILTVEWQLISAEGMTKLEKHHLATITVIIISGKKHQWMPD